MDEKKYLDRLQEVWTRSWPSGVPREPEYPFGEVLLTDCLRRRARQTPDKPCLIYCGTGVTFRQIDDWSERFAALLNAKGLPPVFSGPKCGARC